MSNQDLKTPINSPPAQTPLSPGSNISYTLDELLVMVKANDEKCNEKLKVFIDNNDLYKFIWSDGNSLLHLACLHDNLVIADYILKKKKLHVNIKNRAEQTPLKCNLIKKANELGVDVSDIVERSNITEIIDEKKSVDLKSDSNLFVKYHHRLSSSWDANLNYFLSGDKKALGVFKVIPENNQAKASNLQISVIPEAKELFTKRGISALSDKCKEILDKYVDLRDKFFKNQLDDKICLYCGKNVKLLRCTKCKKVLFCNIECQKNAYKLHKLDCAQ